MRHGVRLSVVAAAAGRVCGHQKVLAEMIERVCGTRVAEAHLQHRSQHRAQWIRIVSHGCRALHGSWLKSIGRVDVRDVGPT
jgi:hypothetical protein